MWKKIRKQYVEEDDNIIPLKRDWLYENGFIAEEMKNTCFFCEHTMGEDYDYCSSESCSLCPGVLVDPTFDCCSDDCYYQDEPDAFYKELLRLNRIRKAKTGGQ